MIKIEDVVSVLINTAIDMNIYLNSTKVNKLLYLVYGVYLYNYEPLFSHTKDKPRLFKNGPVFDYIQKYEENKIDFENKNNHKVKLSRNIRSIIKIVLKSFGKYNAVPLANWSMRKGGAWYEVSKKDTSMKWGIIIDDELIEKEMDKIITKRIEV